MDADNHARDPVILSAVRTPMGRFQGALAGLPAPRLGAVVVKEALARSGCADWEQVDEVLMGNVVSAGVGQAPARQAAIFAGLPPTVFPLRLASRINSIIPREVITSKPTVGSSRIKIGGS